ncbi:AraC family transcriptional regulator [Parasporobacterium paucivorans]|nr:AraC family transcriptional regulator [Parasporobacterium paucivorans]
MDVFSRLLNNRLNWHWHTELELVVILQGTVRYYLGEQCIILSTGDGVFINSGTMHSAEPDLECDDAIMFAVAFSPEFIMAPHSLVYQNCVAPFIANSGFPGTGLYGKIPWQRRILDAIKSLSILEANPTFSYELQYHNNICLAWLEIITNLGESLKGERKKSPPDVRRTKLMMEYIHSHYSEDISITDISESANISKSECFRCFRKVLGKKPFEYLIEYRLEQAIKQISVSDRSISEIAADCGFNHHSYFGKQFKKFTGNTPNEYRKSVRLRHAGESALK